MFSLKFYTPACNTLSKLLTKSGYGAISQFKCDMSSAGESKTDHHFKSLNVTNPKPFVFHVELHRPEKYNAMNRKMWLEIKDCFEGLSTNPDCRVVVLSGSGKFFTAGNDLKDFMKVGQELAQFDDVSRKGLHIGKTLKLYQDTLSSLEVCTKPVIAAVHSGCVGAGVNMITSADIRYCSKDAWFQLKEVEIGMAADVGALQRLPKIVGNQSWAREFCITGRKVDSKEAYESGLVSRIFEDKDAMLQGAFDVAEDIARKSPIAVQATKKSIVYSLDHTNQEGLNHIYEMNMLLLQSEDFAKATIAQLTKEKAEFDKV